VSPDRPERHPYQYVVLRAVPRVDREEFVNVGVVLYCEEAHFLDVAWQVDELRLTALDPAADRAAVCRGLEFVAGVCRGDDALGEIADKELGVRFGFLKAPRSTVVQPGPVHGGITADPAGELERLLDRLVR
jgi:hypothetical protein